MPPIIWTEGLSKRFSAKQTAPGLLGSLRGFVHATYRETVAVHDCTFAVDQGEAVAFIGPNGAGKSTTIKMLTGILHPSGGQARVLGLVPWQQRRLLSYNIAAVFGQKSQLWYHLPPQASFDLLGRIYELEPDAFRERVRYLIDVFEIEPYLQTPVRRLSLGERMRCELAAALLHRPQVIFLDEPTIGLDVIAKQRMRALIRRLNQDDGVTVLLTSHDADDIEQVCRRVLIINHGTIILDEPVQALKRDYLQTKVVELRFQDEASGWQQDGSPGVTVLDQGSWGVRLEVDTRTRPIESVIAHLVANYRVADITISDPPLEEIIGQIYQQRPDAAPPAPADTRLSPCPTPADAPQAAPSSELGTPQQSPSPPSEAPKEVPA